MQPVGKMVSDQLIDLVYGNSGNYGYFYEGIESSSKKIYHTSFVNLDGDQQTEFHETMETGERPEAEWQGDEQRSFFRMLLDHTMQAFYGSPRHGGNCDYVSYKMLKIDYPHVIGQNRYRSEHSNTNLKAS